MSENTEYAEALKALPTEELERAKDRLTANMGKASHREAALERKDLEAIKAELERRAGGTPEPETMRVTATVPGSAYGGVKAAIGQAGGSVIAAYDENDDEAAAEGDPTELLAARGFTAIRDQARELVTIAQNLGHPEDLEQAVEYARSAKARGIVQDVGRDALDRIDVDIMALEVSLEARRTILDYAERLAARQDLTLPGSNGAPA